MANSIEGGALPFPMPPSATGIGPRISVGKTDKAIARSTATKLLTAIKSTNDPQLKATFSQALASLNQHLAQDTKADKQGQARKVSSKAVPKVKPPKKA